MFVAVALAPYMVRWACGIFAQTPKRSKQKKRKKGAKSPRRAESVRRTLPLLQVVSSPYSTDKSSWRRSMKESIRPVALPPMLTPD